MLESRRSVIIALLLVNVVVMACVTAVYFLVVFKHDPYFAAVPGIVAAIGILLQPWFALFVFLPFSILVAPVAASIVSFLVYGFACRKGWINWPKRLWSWLTPKRGAAAVTVIFFAMGGLSFSRYVDFPALYRGTPPPISNRADRAAAEFSNGHYYPLGHFIDSEYLWRADATKAGLDHLVTALQLVQKDSLPPNFFTMPPYWWAPRTNSETRVYATEKFPLVGRGADGLHMMLSYDETSRALHMWIKDNF